MQSQTNLINSTIQFPNRMEYQPSGVVQKKKKKNKYHDDKLDSPYIFFLMNDNIFHDSISYLNPYFICKLFQNAIFNQKDIQKFLDYKPQICALQLIVKWR